MNKLLLYFKTKTKIYRMKCRTGFFPCQRLVLISRFSWHATTLYYKEDFTLHYTVILRDCSGFSVSFEGLDSKVPNTSTEAIGMVSSIQWSSGQWLHDLEGVVDRQHKMIPPGVRVFLIEEVPWNRWQVNQSLLYWAPFCPTFIIDTAETTIFLFLSGLHCKLLFGEVMILESVLDQRQFW